MTQSRNIYKNITEITVKATGSCNANCYHCRDRQEHYTEKNDNNLNPRIAKSIFETFSSPKLRKITISGGEPTIAKQLTKLIMIAKRYCNQVSLNTNGWNNSYTFWEHLVYLGLNHVNISIDGTDPGMHNWLRNSKSLYQKCMKTLKIFNAIRRKESDFDFSIISIISSFNIMTLDKLLKVALENNVWRLVLHYPEADEEALFSPSVKKQERFRKEVIPRMKKLLIDGINNQFFIEDAMFKLDNIYALDWKTPANIAEGLYDAHRDCKVPQTFILSKYDGTLLACNGSEYCNEGIIGYADELGNVRIDDNKWCKIVDQGISYCKFCPVPYSSRIFLRKT